MKAVIKHDIPGRMRVHFNRKRFSYREADTLQYYLQGFKCIEKAVVYERTADAVIRYAGERDEIIRIIRGYAPDEADVPAGYFESSPRELNAEYYDHIVASVALYCGKTFLLPSPVRTILTCIKAARYMWRGVKTIPGKKLKVELLDAAAITASTLFGDYSTASSVMFLLDIGDTLEEWTHKRTTADLARQMSLNVSRVWKVEGEEEVQTDADLIETGDRVLIRMGNIIPFDGVVEKGEALVNQASMTGEAIPVRKKEGASVFAGTVVDEGEITIRVTAVGGNGRYDKIVRMIEESEKLKSNTETRAFHLADKLVPYSLGGTVLTWLLTRNVNKALSFLMVDFSCALKLSMPLSVLSAIREAGECDITVKGGKFLEAAAGADTIVFDKTGTLTHATPEVVGIVTFGGADETECLRLAACLEEHYPHSIANAVVAEAAKRSIIHDEMHSKVQYVVAHGISSSVNGKKTVIGSYHFIFEDEGCKVPEGEEYKLEALSPAYSHLYLALDGMLIAVLCIFDPLRKEAPDVINSLHEMGLSKVCMMTGDNRRTAEAIAAELNIDEFHAEVLPDDKASFVKDQRKGGHTVIMIGDGVNDAPALSEADVGVAISDGAAIAREVADVTVSTDSLYQLLILRRVSEQLMRRIHFHYKFIMSFNALLIALGVFGILPPASSALLHNGSTIVTGLWSMTPLLDDKEKEELLNK